MAGVCDERIKVGNEVFIFLDYTGLVHDVSSYASKTMTLQSAAFFTLGIDVTLWPNAAILV